MTALAMAKEMQLRFALEDVCDRISSLQQFAEVLEVEHLMRDFLENEKYTTQDIHEKVAKCMTERRSRSREDLDWYYWRNILLQIDEGELVEDMEEKYPCLLQDERIDISHVAHKALDEFGILAHDASKIELFEKIELKVKDRIKVCVGAGKENMFAVKKVKEIPTLQDNYFEKYEILEKIKMYDFSSINRHEECRILKTLYKWLQKNDDYGFCIKGYDLQQHLQLMSVSYVNKAPKDSYILLYSEKYNVIFHIDTNSVDIKKSMRNNRSNIRTLRTLNSCLDNVSFVYVPVTLFDPLKHKIDNKIICKTCINLKLVVSVEVFKTLESFEEWWCTISNEVKDITGELKEKTGISDDFFRNIMTFMAFDSFALPSFTKNPKNEIREVQKIIMLTPEQQDVIYSINKYKIIKGSFGSGKTVVAQKIIKLVTQNSKELELVYYIFHESDSAFINEMQKLAKELKKENLIACKRSDLVKDNKLLSSLLQYLLEKNEGRTIHVFIEEFNGEILDKLEVEKVKKLLENKEFKNSHIVIVAQSMESERSETDNDFQTTSYETYQFEKLAKETEFKIFNLSYLLRSSLYINDIIHATIPILKNVILKSVIPKTRSQFSSKKKIHTSIPVIKVNENFKRSITVDSTTEISSPNKRCCDDNYSTNSQNKTIIDSTPNNKSDDEELKIGTSFLYDKNYMQESKTKTGNETITSYNVTDDTCKFLKQCTILSEKYPSKINIQSSYSYIGDRKNAHNVKGKLPVVYYPFHVKYKNFAHQIYSLCKVLKVITNDNEEQVIICMNKVSMNTIKIALEINKTKWTNDPKLLSTSEFHVLLTDYISVRGCEFLNVLLVLPLDEQHLKHNLVDCIGRCVLNLIVIVLNQGFEDETLAAILNEWINKKLVTVSSEDYLKNVKNEELKKFELINNDLLNEQCDTQSMDLNDPKVIQKIKSFSRQQSGSSSVVQTSNENLIIKSTTSFKGGNHRPFINEENTTNYKKRKLVSIDKNVELIPGFILFFPEKDNDVIIPGSILNNSSQKCKSNIEYFEGNPVDSNRFFTTLYINGIYISWGSGDTKKESKYECANNALEKLKLCQPIIYKESHEIIETVDRKNLVKESYNIAEKIKDDDIVGCSGTGGIGKSGSGIADPVFVDAADGRKGVGNNDMDQTIQKRSVDERLKLFSGNPEQDHIKFSSDLTSTDRKLVHQLCERYHLKHKSFGKNDNRYLVVSRK